MTFAAGRCRVRSHRPGRADVKRSGAVYDLVVIGCGAAGLSAAIAYLEGAGGSRVAVLERAPEAERGGASRWTTARMRVDAEGRLDPTFAEVVVASHPDA